MWILESQNSVLQSKVAIGSLHNFVTDLRVRINHIQDIAPGIGENVKL